MRNMKTVCLGLVLPGLFTGILTPRAEAQAIGGKPMPGVQAKAAGLVDGQNQFAFDLYQKLRSGDENLFFSPPASHSRHGHGLHRRFQGQHGRRDG